MLRILLLAAVTLTTALPLFKANAGYSRLEAQVRPANDSGVHGRAVWERDREMGLKVAVTGVVPNTSLAVHVCGPSAFGVVGQPGETVKDRCWLALPGLIANSKGRASRDDMMVRAWGGCGALGCSYGYLLVAERIELNVGGLLAVGYFKTKGPDQ